jgi:hypothetical protein
MAFATHLGPWLLGTLKDTTGTTAGTVRNTGATIVAQTKTIAYNDAAASLAMALPAGALITGMQLIQTTSMTSGTSGTFTVLVNGVAAAAATITTGTAGTLTLAPASTAQAAIFNNVGATDALVTYTGATLSAGAGTLVVSYMVRAADGSSFPVSA